MKKLHGFIQNLRIYSFIDIVLLLYVIGAQNFELLGGIFLWIFFLLYLEWRHKHKYRAKVPIWLWIIFLALGLTLYPVYAGLGFTIFVFLYCEKNKGSWAILGPVFRGFQMAILASPFLGFISPVTLAIWILFFVRNLLGDFRDTKKDIKEQMYTIPVALGFKKSIPHVHLLSVMATTYIWWLYSDINFLLVPIMWIIQILTYKLTPR